MYLISSTPTETRRPAIARPLVVIPTYNERENLPLILTRLHTVLPNIDVLILDDNSPDGTGRIADSLAAGDSRIRVLHRAGKAGLGSAYIAGFVWALNANYDAIIEMDADGSHAPEELPDLFAALDHADVVLGSRWVRGGTVRNWPLSRRVLSKGGNLYTRFVLGLHVRDATGGYRVYRRGALELVDLTAVSSQGYCFQVDVAWRAIRAGCTVVEVPITFTERQLGESKMSGPIVREALLNITRWGIRQRRNQLINLFSRPASGLRSRGRSLRMR